ncbi:hypothetical protein [Azospirillum argentinense]
METSWRPFPSVFSRSFAQGGRAGGIRHPASGLSPRLWALPAGEFVAPGRALAVRLFSERPLLLEDRF